MSFSPMPLCHLCTYFEGGLNDLGVTACKAFPEGIPTEIIDGLEPHFQPLAGEPVTFKPRKGVTPDMVDEWTELSEQTRPLLAPGGQTGTPPEEEPVL